MKFITIGMWFGQFPKGTEIIAIQTVGNMERYRIMDFKLAIPPTESTTHLKFK